MNIEISDQTTKKIEAVIGTSDPETVGRFLERIAQDEQLLQAFMLEDPSDEELRESAAMCERGMEDIKAGRSKPFDDAMNSVRDRLGFELPK